MQRYDSYLRTSIRRLQVSMIKRYSYLGSRLLSIISSDTVIRLHCPIVSVKKNNLTFDLFHYSIKIVNFFYLGQQAFSILINGDSWSELMPAGSGGGGEGSGSA
jgi:hypothetical protein